MKVGRFRGEKGAEHLGAVVESAAGLQVVDLTEAQRLRPDLGCPANMAQLIASGSGGLDAAYLALEWARREGGWQFPESSVEWLVPLQARNCIAGGRNFGKHLAESAAYWSKQGVTGFHYEIPMGFIKLSQSMVPTRANVRRPEGVVMFDYEIEAVAVIGTRVEGVSEQNALKAVFGYTIMNDLSARELQRKEMANQAILLGKNFPGFCPLGPWILTADEVPDPAKLVLDLKVNGETRQHSSCEDLIFSFPVMIAHWSRMGLDAGDLISTGSPDGVATARQPDPMPFYLKPGDVVHASVEQIGVLETRIV